MLSLFSTVIVPAHRRLVWGYSVGDILILIVILAACIALVVVALRQFQVTIPEWVKQVFWIVLVAFVVILAIRIVLAM